MVKQLKFQSMCCGFRTEINYYIIQVHWKTWHDLKYYDRGF